MNDTKKYGFSLDMKAFAVNLEKVMHLTQQKRERDLVRLPELRFFGVRYRLPNGAVFVGKRCLNDGTELPGVHCIELQERLPDQESFDPKTYHLTRFAKDGENMTILEWGTVYDGVSWQSSPTTQKCYSDYMISKKQIENGFKHKVGSIEYCRDVLESMTSAAPPKAESQGLVIRV